MEYGEHSRIREEPTPVDVKGTLDAEFNRTGQIMVSGKYPYSQYGTIELTDLKSLREQSDRRRSPHASAA